MDLDSIIKTLNEKRYAQNEVLTEEERSVLNIYTPENRLIVYGTLAPNKPNHRVVEHIRGTWFEGIVKGKLESKGWGAALGYNGFKPATIEEQQLIKAYILFSNELVANWQMLDEFEGNGYKRIFAKFELENGDVGIGNIYALNDE
ncbi:MAG: gamma-glutamylcyclotransferase family protein [Emticicia sp.]|uniref:gamma-glutamylcyclotransferase family protein n=1 Tax=Emticicia sp. TaxID=1930953 RepID=UPI003BA67252